MLMRVMPVILPSLLPCAHLSRAVDRQNAQKPLISVKVVSTRKNWSYGAPEAASHRYPPYLKGDHFVRYVGEGQLATPVRLVTKVVVAAYR